MLEVLLATAVMTVSLGGAIIGLQIGMRNLELARATTAVGQVLQSEAERLRLLNWTALEALSTGPTTLTLPSGFQSPSLGDGVTMTRTINDVSGFPDMKEIVLRASWRSRDGVSHERAFRLRYSKGGLHDYYYSAAS